MTTPRALVLFTAILSGIVALSLVVYFPLVHLTYTFTHDDLPDDNVPFYIHDDAGNPTEKSSGRLGLYWWVYASDSLRLLFPALAGASLFLRLKKTRVLTGTVVVVLALLALWELAKFVWAVILWIPSNCKNHQFCRNFGARRTAGGAEIGEDPQRQNFAYEFMVWYNLAFFLVTIAYLYVVVALATRDRGPTPKPKPERKELDDPGSLPWWTFAATLILAGLLLFFLPLTFLNLTFTDGNETEAGVPAALRFNLPDDNVPYYVHDDPSNPTEKSSGRFGLYWWVHAGEALLILAPVLSCIHMNELVSGKKGFPVVLQLTLAAFLLWFIVKLVWLAALAVPTLCEAHQFCRAFGARRDVGGAEVGGNPRNLNFVYSSAVWFDLAFVIVLGWLLWLISSAKGAISGPRGFLGIEGKPTFNRKSTNRNRTFGAPPQSNFASKTRACP